ncbi:ATP-binding cassette domain-containing protein [Jatrophihabitans telluris]|uniref:ATP-binding cassette domain-containing protein n=1 Tax=Jatrophihabitans telluris TaxID=2038343 RepID=A0ABY4R109_9ACTN|nr:ATP-binding cassette domain-containing protein [Jatrophihabitans telluris]UQX89007.1 ATP-binding cassette domain-containing protein [Jatrophihabitans telluris]
MSDVPILQVAELVKIYGGRRGPRGGGLVAVDDVSFTLESRGCLAVVGESGSGKTTTARIIAGLEQASSGRVSVDGQPWNIGRLTTRERRRRARVVQMVFQDPYQSLDRRQTVGACLHETLRLHFDLSSAERASRVAELLELVGLTADHARVRPRMLSGGQRQRVAIARALAPQPRLLILDEAVAALDVSIQAQILNLLTDAREKTGVAMLFISHDLGVVRQVADSVVVMKDGHVVEHGPADRIFGKPEHAYTQRLLNSTPRPGWRPVARAAT